VIERVRLDDFFSIPSRAEPEDGIEPVPSTRRTSWTAADLLAADLPEPRYAVEGIVPEGLTFMCGAPKLGKSWMGLALGTAVASGGYALSSVEVEQGDVLYMALEDNARRLQGRLRLLLNGARPPHGLHFELEWPRLDEGGIERLTEWLDSHPEARLVIIDVYPRVRPREGSSRDRFQTDYAAAAMLQAVAVNYGVAIVALYHTRKAEATDFVETVQGTFGTAAAADTIVVVKRARGEADATLHITGRDVLEQELALRFTPAAGTWELLGDAAEYALGETRKLILETVRIHGALTPKKVSELTSVDYNLAKTTMWRMANDGQLVAKAGSYTLSQTAVTPVTAVTLDENSAQVSDFQGYTPPVTPVTEEEDVRIVVELGRRSPLDDQTVASSATSWWSRVSGAVCSA
jgi:hypothetical protein